MSCLTLFGTNDQIKVNLAGQDEQYTKVYVVLPQNPNIKAPLRVRKS